MNIVEYNQVLDRAERSAVMLNKPVLVVYYGRAGFGEALLSDYVARLEGKGYQIAASVDHEGNITPSQWIQEQIQKIGEAV